MGKLYELLAVELSLKKRAQQALSQIKGLFASGRGRFTGQIRHYEPLEEDGEELADEITILATSVDKELSELAVAFSPWLNVAVQKEITNAGTGANVIVGEEVVFEGLPAPALLNLEKKLDELKAVYSAIPTNDPAERWTYNGQQDCYVSPERVTYRGKKVPRSFVQCEATKEHPAQVTVYYEDIRVGTWRSTILSGMLSPQRKQQMLERIGFLAIAVKQARHRANAIDVVTDEIAPKVFEFIHRE